MVETQDPPVISDIDIEANIYHTMAEYPPFMHDRHRVDFSIENGVVTVSGYVKSRVTYTYVVNRLKDIKGVREVVTGDFYNDDDLRRDVGHVVPPGVMVTMEYGGAILSGQLPEGTSVEALVKAVGLIPGVHRVITSL